jgi:hypothetical protein
MQSFFHSLRIELIYTEHYATIEIAKLRMAIQVNPSWRGYEVLAVAIQFFSEAYVTSQKPRANSL